MFRDVFRAVLRKPATERYPDERAPVPATLRGMLHWSPERCTGCSLCTKDCPADAIHLHTVDKAAKRFVIEYHADRCVYCGQCVQSCRFDCISLANDEWELASTGRDAFTVYYGDPEDVHAVVAGTPSAAPAVADKDDQPD